jgi:integrase
MALEMKVVGLDVAKNVFQVHGVDRRGETVLRRRLRRIASLKVWRAKNPNTLLIFPNQQGRPDGHLLDKLKDIAKNAKLNCGHCESTHSHKPVTFKTHAVCEQWYLHKFRHTFACSALLAEKPVDIRNLQLWLGHSDLETTSQYLRAIQGKQKNVREKVNDIFAGIKVKPMTQEVVATIQ